MPRSALPINEGRRLVLKNKCTAAVALYIIHRLIIRGKKPLYIIYSFALRNEQCFEKLDKVASSNGQQAGS